MELISVCLLLALGLTLFLIAIVVFCIFRVKEANTLETKDLQKDIKTNKSQRQLILINPLETLWHEPAVFEDLSAKMNEKGSKLDFKNDFNWKYAEHDIMGLELLDVD